MHDFYHIAISHGDVMENLKFYLPKVGHIQIAGIPKRNEPDDGLAPDSRGCSLPPGEPTGIGAAVTEGQTKRVARPALMVDSRRTAKPSQRIQIVEPLESSHQPVDGRRLS